MRKTDFLLTKDDSLIEGIDNIDLAMLRVITNLSLETKNGYAILRHKKLTEDADIDIDENEMFARLQHMVEVGLLLQELIPAAHENGDRRWLLGYRVRKIIY